MLATNRGRVVLALVAAACLAAGYGIGLDNAGIDFFLYWTVPRAVEERWTADIYSPEGGRVLAERAVALAQSAGHGAREQAAARTSAEVYHGSLEVLGTPFLCTVFSLFDTGNYERDYEVFLVVRLIAYLAGVVALARMLGYPLETTLAMVAMVTFCFAPFTSGARSGNVGQLQVAGLALFVVLLEGRRWRGHTVAAGVVLGTLVTFKPNLAFVAVTALLVVLADRRVRDAVVLAASAAAGSLGAVAVSSAFFGSWHCWRQWLAIVPRLLATGHGVDEGNYSLSRVLLEWTGLDLSRVALVALCAAVVGVMWLRWSRGRRVGAGASPDRDGGPYPGSGLLAAAVGGSLGLLTLRLAWLHYYLLLVPMILWVFRPSREHEVRRGAVYGGLAAVALALLTEAANVTRIVGLTLPEVRYPIAALLLLGLGLWELAAGRRDAGIAPAGAPLRPGAPGSGRRARALGSRRSSHSATPGLQSDRFLR